MKTHDFLLELGTEELPPKLLIKLSNTLRDNLVEELEQLGIAIGKVSAFATPRRLAVNHGTQAMSNTLNFSFFYILYSLLPVVFLPIIKSTLLEPFVKVLIKTRQLMWTPVVTTLNNT